ncbi:hypothetical protein Ahy_A06g029125 isoform B [Arachis hypogaea]|uniref:Uncharacterized protein n=1 Tax=Arachis hypogaea TaxID=3818 RepID=A0A445CSH2_ARAHY|nr:hypothetical protein Ahy_A06g029125 isoform B [Arachis hypogaea]
MDRPPLHLQEGLYLRRGALCFSLMVEMSCYDQDRYAARILEVELTPINTNSLHLHHAFTITLSTISSTVTLSSHPHSHYRLNRIPIALPHLQKTPRARH